MMFVRNLSRILTALSPLLLILASGHPGVCQNHQQARLSLASGIALASGKIEKPHPIVGNASAQSESKATAIFYNGVIIPVSGSAPEVAAMAIRNDRILAVGDLQSVLRTRSLGTLMINLKGKALLPGFIDPHAHTTSTGILGTVWLDVRPTTTPRWDGQEPNVQSTLKTAVAKARPSDWVIADGYEPWLMNGPGVVTRDMLDSISSKVPIFLLNLSGHVAYVNSAAIRRANIADNAPDPPGGVFGRYPNSTRLNGVLYEGAAFDPFLKIAPPPNLVKVAAGTLLFLKRYASVGVTSVNDALVGIASPGEVDALKALSVLAPVRIHCWLDGSKIDDYSWLTKYTPNQGDLRFRIVGMKWISDGSTQGLSAAVTTPYIPTDETYYPPYGHTGKLNYDTPELMKLLQDQVQRAHDAGWSANIHANGDAAIDQILDMYETIQTKSPRTDVRHTIQHCTTARREQIARMRHLRVSPSFLSGHLYYWGSAFHDKILGPERGNLLDPFAWAFAPGFDDPPLPFSFHSDSPVSPPEPLRWIQTAVTRLSKDGTLLDQDNQMRIPVDEAIKAVTLYAAWQLHRETDIGSLEPGKLADFVILEQNPRLVTPSQIAAIKVRETWMGGVRRY